MSLRIRRTRFFRNKSSLLKSLGTRPEQAEVSIGAFTWKSAIKNPSALISSLRMSLQALKLLGGTEVPKPIWSLASFEYEYEFSISATNHVRLDVCSGVSVKTVVDLLLQHGTQRYEFNGAGEGCRFWTTTQLDLLQRNGLATHPSQINAAKQAILINQPSSIHHPLAVGAFY